ncbi:hypothetical protein THAOC_04802 [Thalassiosira oceanica]|uniref:Uncharacterized protein n=1 Tax=Thalassiosira oceanica TaxID=159749 RepID=K0TNI5_THAOC|nr:hypothetical protein THAOC_04802 [Thalassiosira oceanica]|eukprot:EJK73562.1 hypothetical protein THAOC_04802 [Thalassiosira oceanica]
MALMAGSMVRHRIEEEVARHGAGGVGGPGEEGEAADADAAEGEGEDAEESPTGDGAEERQRQSPGRPVPFRNDRIRRLRVVSRARREVTGGYLSYLSSESDDGPVPGDRLTECHRDYLYSSRRTSFIPENWDSLPVALESPL